MQSYLLKKLRVSFHPTSEHAIVDQFNLTYVPRVVAIQKGTAVNFPNSDAVRHNVFSPLRTVILPLRVYHWEKYALKTWHEKLKEVSQEVTVDHGKTNAVNFELKRR